MFRFNLKYFILTIIFFATEVCIAVFAHDKIIRPFVGDVLVVILIYCFLQSFLKLPVMPAAIAVLAFSFAIETGQYFHYVRMLGLEKYQIARIVLGTSFEWTDLLAYTLGIIIVVCAEKIKMKKA